MHACVRLTEDRRGGLQQHAAQLDEATGEQAVAEGPEESAGERWTERRGKGRGGGGYKGGRLKGGNTAERGHMSDTLPTCADTDVDNKKRTATCGGCWEYLLGIHVYSAHSTHRPTLSFPPLQDTCLSSHPNPPSLPSLLPPHSFRLCSSAAHCPDTSTDTALASAQEGNAGRSSCSRALR